MTLYPGDVITVRQREEAYYSDYAGNPVVWFEPGDEAVVNSGEKMPSVYRDNVSFITADFVRDGKKWRIGPITSNIRLVRRV